MDCWTENCWTERLILTTTIMKKNKLFLFIVLFFAWGNFVGQNGKSPIKLHPENPHYFLYKGKPTVLISSAEHYGAVLNTDFDFEKYLQTLHREGMNYTRIFTGSYVEIPGSFGIGNNTLAPAVGSFLAPWKRVEQSGKYKGEKKFDLSQWNPEYFERLRQFVTLAEKLDIIVEVTFYSSTYQDSYWERNPFNSGNNINNIAVGLNRKKSNTLENGVLTEYQKKMVAKIVEELNEYNNVIFEIQNEPWSDDPQKVMRTLRTLDPQPQSGGWYKWADMASKASLKWQKEMASVVAETEKTLPKKHLIAQNYTNFKYSLEEVDPNISILNFHYVWPEAVWMNYPWNRVIGFDESGFAGSSDTTYLRQAWQFMLSGGALFNNLDYSFFVEKEDGTGQNNAPGGGSTNFRKQLTYLKSFLESFNFIKMEPDFDIVYHSPGLQWQAISQHKKQYAIIFTGTANDWIKLNLPKGNYQYEFISPFTGKTLQKGSIKGKKKGAVRLDLPDFYKLIALKIK